MTLNLTQLRNLLEEERTELTRQQTASDGDRAPVMLDQQSVGRLSRMDALQVQAMAKALESRRKIALSQIDAALGRRDSGDYGYCVSCDEPIAPKRLELDPKVATCIACAG
ncbi:MAG: TraR/DksA family transcriptional regulator [Candidatus Phaeomarinobacter sp.]